MQQAAGAAWRTQRDGPSTDLRVRLVRLTRKERDRQRPHGKVRKRGAATAATEKTQSRARRRHQRKKPMLATIHRKPSPAGRAALHPRGQRINIHRSAGAVSVSPSSLSRESSWSKYLLPIMHPCILAYRKELTTFRYFGTMHGIAYIGHLRCFLV